MLFRSVRLARELPGLEVATWKDMAADVVAITQAKRGGTSFVLFSVFIIALIGISNTILLAAFERTKEIGMMAAMGMKRRQIVTLFVMEGTLIGTVGSAIGCLAGFLLVPAELHDSISKSSGRGPSAWPMPTYPSMESVR